MFLSVSFFSFFLFYCLGFSMVTSAGAVGVLKGEFCLTGPYLCKIFNIFGFIQGLCAARDSRAIVSA